MSEPHRFGYDPCGNRREKLVIVGLAIAAFGQETLMTANSGQRPLE